MKYSIGEFSQIGRVTVKALRLYHEKGLLAPDFIDPESGYRYYSEAQVNELRVITSLKEMGFSLSEIKEILESCDEDRDLVERLQEKRRELERRISRFQRSIDDIELIVKGQNAFETSASTGNQVEEKALDTMLVAGYRMSGRYADVGKGFRVLGRHAGRYATGKSMCLYFDEEYREDDANFEPCLEVKRIVDHDEINCRELPGGVALTVLHRGPYERLSESYAKLFTEMKRRGLRIRHPSREVYLKGPGMILKGNPKNYLTEVQFLIE